MSVVCKAYNNDDSERHSHTTHNTLQVATIAIIIVTTIVKAHNWLEVKDRYSVNVPLKWSDSLNHTQWDECFMMQVLNDQV